MAYYVSIRPGTRPGHLIYCDRLRSIVMQSPLESARGGLVRALTVVLLGALALGATGWSLAGQASEAWIQQGVIPAAPGAAGHPVVGTAGTIAAAILIDGQE